MSIARISCTMHSGPPRVVWILILGVLVFGASYMFGVAWRAANIQESTAEWPTCEGVIVDSRVEERTAVRGGNHHEPIVRYRYVVNGVDRLGSDTSFNPIRIDRQSAYEFIAKYPVGQAVRVWYSPEDPTRSVLDASPADWSAAGLLGVILAFVTTGFALAVFWPWIGDKPPHQVRSQT
ncbi:MAG: DUF3592 domain-containing protein [Tepidisphaera sp.]